MTKSGHCCTGCCDNPDHIHNQNKENFIKKGKLKKDDEKDSQKEV